MYISIFITRVVLAALLAAFILTLSRKWGVLEWVQVHGSEFFSKMFSCNFCLSWWTSVVISIVWCAATEDTSILVIPFFSTPITRVLL